MQDGPIFALFADGQMFTERFTNFGDCSFQLVRGNLFDASELENDEHFVAFLDQGTRNLGSRMSINNYCFWPICIISQQGIRSQSSLEDWASIGAIYIFMEGLILIFIITWVPDQILQFLLRGNSFVTFVFSPSHYYF